MRLTPLIALAVVALGLMANKCEYAPTFQEPAETPAEQPSDKPAE